MQEKGARKGIYVPVYCPYCGQCLNIKGDQIRLGIQHRDDHGLIYLSAILDDFSKRLELIDIPEGDTVVLSCPKHGCGSILNIDRTCPRCNARQVSLFARYVSGDAPIFICSRVGCNWHEIKAEKLV